MLRVGRKERAVFEVVWCISKVGVSVLECFSVLAVLSA